MCGKRRRFLTVIILTVLISLIPVGTYADTGMETDQPGALQNILQDIERNVSAQMTIEEFAAGVAKINEENSELSLFSSSPEARLIVKADREPDVCGADEIFGGYDGYYIVRYENENAAEEGKNSLLSQDCVQCVAEDEKLQLYASGPDYDYQTLKNWSRGEEDPLGIEYINDQILKKYDDSVEKMPQVTVAVIDSGVTLDHPFLSGRLTEGISLAGDDAADVSDSVGHGTSVAGIIADVSLPNVKIMPVRVADEEGTVYASAVIAGIKASQEKGADVINMSLGAKGKNTVMEAAVLEAERAGIICVAAAGNKGEDASGYYPANMESVIGVSNLSDKENLYAGSNFGDVIDLAAPGTGICTSDKNGEMTESFSGTSAAAPFVSAAAAIVHTLLYEPESGQSPEAEKVIECLYENAADIGETGKDPLFGYGRLNFLNFNSSSGGESEEDTGEAGGEEEAGEDTGEAAEEDNVTVHIEKTDSRYIVSYEMSEESPQEPGQSDQELLLCITQYDRNGKMLKCMIGRCTDKAGEMAMDSVEESTQAKAFLLTAADCRAAAGCAAA